MKEISKVKKKILIKHGLFIASEDREYYEFFYGSPCISFDAVSHLSMEGLKTMITLLENQVKEIYIKRGWISRTFAKRR